MPVHTCMSPGCPTRNASPLLGQTGQEIAHDCPHLLRAAGEEVVGGAQDVQGLGFRQASQEVVQGRQRRQLVGVTGDE